MTGASASQTGLSPSVEPASSLDGFATSIPSALEFRPDHKGRFDEIVARFADGMVHVETLTNKTCYVGFYWDDGRYCQWYIAAGKKGLEYHHEDGMSAPPRFTAQGIDTRSVETEGLSPKGESPVGDADASKVT